MLEKEVGEFLRRKRGDLTFDQFSIKLGLSASTLFRIENGQQGITLETLQQIMQRLRCDLPDIFPGRFQR